MPKRNILVFLCDQLRPDFLNVYECDAAPTPNLDRLAQQGVVFDQAITQSTVCAPARASMMTGRYVSDHRVWTNDVPFRDGLEYIAERMNQEGYVTGAFGKLHHYPADDPKGFRHVRLMEENRLGEREPYLHWLRQRHPEVESVFNHEGLQFAFPEEEYYEHWIASEAISFIGQTLEDPDPKPFLAWVSFQGPHTPYDPPQEVKETCNPDALPRPLKRLGGEVCPIHTYRHTVYPPPAPEVSMAIRTAYAEMIVEIDKQIGRIIRKLEEEGVFDNTTIVFSSDHGDLLGDFGLVSKGPFPYRGQLDIPLIVTNHPRIAPRTRSESLVGNIDIPATLLDIAGAGSLFAESRSLLDQAQERPEYPREVNYSEHGDCIKIVETGRYRYCTYPFLHFAELFDKEADPDEQVNLAGRLEYGAIEIEFLKHINDFAVISKRVEIPAYDFVPDQQAGLRAKSPDYDTRGDFKVAYPLNKGMKERLEKAGLSSDYNEFCRHLEILADCGTYWE